MRILVINTGNTRTSVTIVADDRVEKVKFLPTSQTIHANCKHIIKQVVDKINIDGSALCSVVPKVNDIWIKIIRDTLKIIPLQINYKLKLNISLTRYKQPERLGADRIANVSGATAKYGTPVIVADFGTALTLDVVSAKKEYIGGIIAPGPALITEYLADRTALLPRIKFTGNYTYIGRNTKEAMILGARVGYRGMVRELLNYLLGLEHLNGPILCATGGYGKVISKELKDFNLIYDPFITQYGIALIWRLNNTHEKKSS